MGRYVSHKSNKMTQAREDSLHGLVSRLSIPSIDISVLDCAFTHTSYANEHKSKHIHHNQRLEFLGDAVLDLVIGEYLFKQYPDMSEGSLTKIKAATVCEDSLASVSRTLHLGNYLLLGHGEKASGGNDRNSILADTFESLIGALYITTDFETVRQFVLSHLLTYIKQALEGKRGKDYKTLLQEFVQRDGDKHIVYNLISESGPDHAKTFCMSVSIDGIDYESGSGKSKKIAEQHAAQLTLEKLMAAI